MLWGWGVGPGGRGCVVGVVVRCSGGSRLLWFLVVNVADVDVDFVVVVYQVGNVVVVVVYVNVVVDLSFSPNGGKPPSSTKSLGSGIYLGVDGQVVEVSIGVSQVVCHSVWS